MSKLEDLFAAQLSANRIGFKREHRILDSRRFRADFLIYPGLLVEINGQGPQGRHGGFHQAASDAEKLSACACLGWRVVVATGPQVRSGEALRWVRCALGIEGDPEGIFSLPVKPRRSRAATGRQKRKMITKTLANSAVTKLPERVRRAANL